MEIQKALLLIGIAGYGISYGIFSLWKNTLTHTEAYQYSIGRKAPPTLIIVTYVFQLVSVLCVFVAGMVYLYNFL